MPDARLQHKVGETKAIADQLGVDLAEQPLLVTFEMPMCESRRGRRRNHAGDRRTRTPSRHRRRGHVLGVPRGTLGRRRQPAAHPPDR